VLPNFLCIGAQKSGTTSIWHILQSHPDICMARPRETRFFVDPHSFEQGPYPYEIHCFGHWRGEKAIGEKCPEYLSEPGVPQRVRALLGDGVRLIVVLRSPAQRAHSHYRHNRNMLRECRSFPAAIAAELDGEASGEPVPGTYSYLARGRYAVQLERYLAVFAPEQLLLVSFEAEIQSNQRALANRLYRFLGVTPFEPPGLPFRAGHPRLEELSIQLRTSVSATAAPFLAVEKSDRRRWWAPQRLLGVRAVARTSWHIHRPSASLTEFAEQFATTAAGDQRLSRARELEMNRIYFRQDIERLRSLVPFAVQHWLDDPVAEARAC
jgi:Sulfotransferase domain